MVHKLARFLLPLTSCLLILLLPTNSISQNNSKRDDEKIKTAAERSKKATEVLKQVAALSEAKGIPKDITDKMNLIGVIPNASQLSLLFSKGFSGRGVSCLRQDDGWSLPSFYGFGQANGFDLSGIGSKHFDIIMVVVNARTEAKKKKDKTTSTPNDKKGTEKPQPYIYAFADGILKPIALRTGFLAALAGAQTNIVYDKSLNNAVYGAKGDDILLGKIDGAKQIPPEVTAFRDVVNQVYPRKK